MEEEEQIGGSCVLCRIRKVEGAKTSMRLLINYYIPKRLFLERMREAAGALSETLFWHISCCNALVNKVGRAGGVILL